MRIDHYRDTSLRKYIAAATAPGIHLYPYRTEKLSPDAPMVLPEGGWESRLLPHFSGEGLHDWRVICPSPFLFVRQG